MTAEQSVYFKQLTLKEKQSKLAHLAKSGKNSITLWKKGESKKYKFDVSDFFRSKLQLLLTGNVSSNLKNTDVLYTFDFNGLHFFGKGKTVIQEGKLAALDIVDHLFKSERRANFRLLTYPHHNVFVQIAVPHEEIEKSNVVSFKTGQSQTGLFNSFMNLVGDSADKSVRKGYVKFRVLDVSVTGLAIQFGDIEADFFQDMEKELGNMFIDFNGEDITIPNGKILYKVDFLARDKKTRLYKAGLKFTDIDINLDEALAKLINEALRDVESEFEDFVK
jgi:hypothetical protein